MAQHLHNQTPTARLTDDDYETLMTDLGEQLTARCIAEGFPADAAPKAACDALANAFGTADDQTVLDWLTAAGNALDVSVDDCVGA